MKRTVENRKGLSCVLKERGDVRFQLGTIAVATVLCKAAHIILSNQILTW